jgi:hypothetical protein
MRLGLRLRQPLNGSKSKLKIPTHLDLKSLLYKKRLIRGRRNCLKPLNTSLNEKF